MTRDEGEETLIGGLVIAAVCDIRGFTDMTATVDAVNQSRQVDPAVKKELLRKYSKLVSETQKVAVHKLVEPFIDDKIRLKKTFDCHRKGLDKVICALKSTGDGFLFAIDATDSEGDPLAVGIQHHLALLVLQGMVGLVKSSAMGDLHEDLKMFLETWEPYLALAEAKEVKRRHGRPNTTLVPKLRESDILWTITYPDYYRLAGAAAIGTGQFTKDAYPHKELIPRGAGEILDIRADAYGHGVNMAFRICDKAGRDDAGCNGSPTPYVLLDRRVGQLLVCKEDKSGYYRMTCFPALDLSRAEFDRPLKGIDERWCYGLILTRARTSKWSTKKKIRKNAIKGKKS